LQKTGLRACTKKRDKAGMARSISVLSALLLLGNNAPAFAQMAAQPSPLGAYDNFKAYAHEKNGKRSCYVSGSPDKMMPANVRRDPVYLFIAHRPKDKVRDEISFQMGYPLKADAPASLEIAGANYPLAAYGEGAWLADLVKQDLVIESMRKAKEITVKGTSARGTATADHYSLKGLAQALDRIDVECPK
jgi:hypothetical protein